MKFKFRSLLRRPAILACFIVFGPHFAIASLGKSVDSIGGDSSRLKAQHTLEAATGAYTVHDLTTSGGLIKEWVNSKGIVFAVTWSAAVQPDLTQLFGAYFQEFKDQSARLSRKHGRHSQLLQTEHLLIQMRGHMRALRGRAILSAEVPPSLSTGDIQ